MKYDHVICLVIFFSVGSVFCTSNRAKKIQDKTQKTRLEAKNKKNNQKLTITKKLKETLLWYQSLSDDIQYCLLCIPVLVVAGVVKAYIT